MRTDRPMSEYESAPIGLFWILCQCLLDHGVLPAERLLSALKALRDSHAEMGARNAAATIDMIISCIEPPPRRPESENDR